MGLTIQCGDDEMNMSYTYVHRFRKALVDATIDLLTAQSESKSKRVKRNDSDDDESLQCKAIKLLETWVAPKPSMEEFMKLAQSRPIWEINLSPIRYESIHWVPAELTALNLAGLHHWVAHADNDGFLSPGQAKDIVALLDVVIPYVEDATHKQKCDELMTVCKTSVASGDVIVFA